MADERTPVTAFNEVGTTGLNHWGGYVQEEFLKNLHGPSGVKVYREMRDNDPVIGAIHHAIDHILRQVTWRVEAASSSHQHQKDKQFLIECMDDLEHTWDEFISEALTKLTFGWSWHEVVYKRRVGNDSRFDDGRIGWRKLPIRAQETLHHWEISDKGEIQGLHQQAPPKFDLTFVPTVKSLLFRTTAHKNNPEGRSILRNAYRPWYFKKRFEEVEGIGIERDLAGLPVMWIPAELMSDSASDEDKAVYEAYKRLVVNVRRDEQEGLVLPMAYDTDSGNPLYKFELVSSGGSRQLDTNGIIERYDQRIAMTAMADFILLGHEGAGSYGLSTSKTGMFRAALRAVVEEIAAVLNRVEVPRLFRLNGLDPDRIPRIMPGEVDPPDLQELGNYVQKLVGAGMPLFPDEDLENYLRQAGKLPMKGEGNASQPGAHLLGPGGGLKAPNAGPSGTRGFDTNGTFGIPVPNNVLERQARQGNGNGGGF